MASPAESHDRDGDAILRQLESESADDRRAAIAKILAGRQESNQQIADLLAKSLAAPDRKATAKDLMLLLGKLHAVEQAPLLVRSLTFKVFYKESKRPQTIEDLYPAVQALADIGAPALDPVLDRLSREDDAELERTGAAVLRDVLGIARATLIVDGAIHSATDAKAKQRLTRALRAMRALPQ
jgi:hypothetical protein